MNRQTLFSITLMCILALCGAISPAFAQKKASEIGKCGYYADSYQGRQTASGEKYNKNALTCSHKSLAFGTKIRVTRLDNKKSVVVRVNDRGPFIEGYVVDVSGAAAKELDLLKVGSARVKIEVVETAESSLASDALVEAEAYADNLPQSSATAKPVAYGKTTTVNTSPKGIANTSATTAKVAPSSSLYKVDIQQFEKKGYGIQISSLSDANNVLPIMKELQARYPGRVLVNVQRDEFNNPTYKVFVGPFADKKTADTAQKTVAKKYKKTMVIDLSGI
ncbi:MAG: hypothetical protein EPGJADBJ_02885 [Saprospiraceae bacterium]|nr:hypothetical protein [Saprospiraceae bacterium]